MARPAAPVAVEVGVSGASMEIMSMVLVAVEVTVSVISGRMVSNVLVVSSAMVFMGESMKISVIPAKAGIQNLKFSLFIAPSNYIVRIKFNE